MHGNPRASGHPIRRFWRFDLGSCQEWRVHLHSYIKIFLNQLPKCLHSVGSSHMELLENDFNWRRFVLATKPHTWLLQPAPKVCPSQFITKASLYKINVVQLSKSFPKPQESMLDPQASKEQPLNIEASAAELSIRIWCAAEPVPLVSRQTSGDPIVFFWPAVCSPWSFNKNMKNLLENWRFKIQPQKKKTKTAKVLEFNNEGLTQLPEAAHGIGQVAEVLFGFDA